MDLDPVKENKVIPKFTSFKPKPAPQTEVPEEKAGRQDRERSDRPKDRHRRPRRRDDSRSGRRSKERHSHHRPHRTERDDGELSRLSRSFATPQPEHPASTDLYVVDKKGDKYNITYGTIHRYSVPQYYRFGRGSVLGLPRNYKIDRDLGDGNSLLIGAGYGGDDSKRLKKRSLLAKASSKELKLHRIRLAADYDTNLDAQKDFLSLDSHVSRKRRKLDSGTLSDDSFSGYEPDLHYRSIEGKAKPELDTPSDLEAISDSDDDGPGKKHLNDIEQSMKRNIELTREVEEHPHDVEAWLILIAFQETLVGVDDGNGSRKLTTAERKSLADIRISLYEKALSKVGPNASRDRLLLGLMEEGSKLWDTKKVASKWKEILGGNAQYISLWVKYLDFQQTRFLAFNYDRCRSIFLEGLRINGASLDSPEKITIQVYLFLRMTLFMREAGFKEHAVALWQALLEFVFYRPENLQGTAHRTTLLSSFAEFWESEVARIGEVGAKGWKHGNSAAVDPKVDSSDSQVNLESIFETWEECELNRELKSRLPARTLDEVEEDDPYRVILFSDVEEFIEPFVDFSSSDLLIDAFFNFCHLPPPPSRESSETCRGWSGDPFLRNDLLDDHDGLSNSFIGERADQNSIDYPIHSFAISVDTLLGDGVKWFSSLNTWKQIYGADRGPLDPYWVRRVLRSLVDERQTDDNLAEFTLALDFAVRKGEAKKYAKSLLKKRPSNLRLYNAFALIQCRLGDFASGENVWKTTLISNKSFRDDTLESIMLWRSWLWENVQCGFRKKAVGILIALGDQSSELLGLQVCHKTGAEVSPAEFLKTERVITETQAQALSLRKLTSFVAATECLAIWFYICNGSDLTVATDIYRKSIERLAAQGQSQTMFDELLHQARARLLHHHMTTTTLYSPALIRSGLLESISLFPENTMFLSLFAANESRFRIDDRVRSVMRQHTFRKDTTKASIMGHFFSVYNETHRGLSAGSTAHSVRAAFERAVNEEEGKPGKSSATLWKLYVLFEVSVAQNETHSRPQAGPRPREGFQRAKDVFYRGIRACPWAKGLIMLAFKDLRCSMDFEELRKVYNVLAEKELRIHVNLEEILEDYDEAQGGFQRPPIQMPEDASSGDED